MQEATYYHRLSTYYQALQTFQSIQGDKKRRKSKYTITMICLANTESLSEVDLAAS